MERIAAITGGAGALGSALAELLVLRGYRVALFDIDKSRYGLVGVHCDVWEGFIFVNLADEPERTLRDFLGPMVTGLEGYPFDQMTSRFYYRSEVKANWKLYMDAFQEFYHAPVLHANQSPSKYSKAAAEAGFEAPHYRIDGPHRLVSLMTAEAATELGLKPGRSVVCVIKATNVVVEVPARGGGQGAR